MRRSWVLLLMSVVAGCTALNAAYGDERQESGSGSASASGNDSTTTTGSDSKTTGETVDPPETTTSTSVDDTGPITSVGTESTDGGSSQTSAPVDCTIAEEDVVSDVFLVSCLSDCANANYGLTEAYFVGAGDSAAHLLLGVSNTPSNTSSVDITVTIRADADALAGDYSLTATAVDTSCDWAPGMQDATVAANDPGATWNACNPASAISWADPQLGVLSTPLEGWTVASKVLDAESIMSGVPAPVTLTLTRDEPGAAPTSIVVSSSVPDSVNFVAFASESNMGPQVAVHYDCP